MGKILETAKIRQMMHEKQALEVRLAWELLEVFNDPKMGFIGQLREMVALSIDMMDSIAKDGRFRLQFQGKWTSNWRNYAVCTDNAIVDWNPEVIKFRSKRFIAQHCADWIRIFGEVIEDIAKGDLDVIRRGFQKGDPYHWAKYEAGKGDQPDAGRRRVTEAGMGKVGVLTDYQREQAHSDAQYWSQRKQQLGNKAGPVAAPPPIDLTVWGFQRDISPSAGLNRWRVMEQDTIGKMDQVFGLMPGATISGTTTDNIFFFKRFGRLGLDPVFYLLPIATIVAAGHHSLLEVGLPLSLNGYGEYRVGLYTTLFPVGSRPANRPSGAGVIEGILRVAENHPTNYLMLVYYTGTRPTGCFLYDNGVDKQKWRNMIWGADLLTVFKFLPAWPNEDQVTKLRKSLRV